MRLGADSSPLARRVATFFAFASDHRTHHLPALHHTRSRPACLIISHASALVLPFRYVQKQQPTEYQALSQLYCVTATYNLEGRTVPFFGGTVVTVYNQGTGADLVGAVNSGGAICARVKDASQPDKLYVAPCFLPNALAGPYWPIYLETNSDGEYTLVVVSGGQPDVVLQEDPPICTTSEQGTNDSGMWILARDAEADPAAIARAEAAMLSMGVGTSELVTVTQGAGCAAAYADRFIKPRDCATPGKCNPSSAAGSCSNFNGFIGGLLCKIFITVFSICI